MKVVRGNHIPFEASFVDLDGDALVPADYSTTPRVQIKDPDGTVITTAVGSPLGTDGTYRFKWFCPESVTINTPENKWWIEWFFDVLGGYTKSSQEFFDVIDKIESTPEERRQTYLGLPGKAERVSIRLEYEPEDIELSIFDGSNVLVTYVNEATTDTNRLNSNDPDRLIGKRVIDGQYVYYYDTDPLNVEEYLVFWGHREDDTLSMDHDQQVIRVPHFNFWRLNKPLRIVVDKLQKKLEHIQSYSDSDVLEYIMRGLGTVNGLYPNTSWGLGDLPKFGDATSGFTDAILLAATLHALNSQQILEIEIGFNHTGQTISLDYNHDYSGVIGNIQSMLDKFAEAKLRLYRVACGIGVAGVRPSRYRLGQRVIKLGDNSGLGGTGNYDPTILLTNIFTGGSS